MSYEQQNTEILRHAFDLMARDQGPQRGPLAEYHGRGDQIQITGRRCKRFRPADLTLTYKRIDNLITKLRFLEQEIDAALESSP